MNTFSLVDAREVLERTPGVLDALLRGTSAAWHRVNEGGETWSAFDVVGHLVHAEETDWIPRARVILEAGTTRPFEPFDRFAQLTRFKESTLDDLLDRFRARREESLQTLDDWALSDLQLDLEGTHPQLGTVTLRQLISTWTVHDLNHLAQIARVMSHRYAAEVGPWNQFLGILRPR